MVERRTVLRGLAGGLAGTVVASGVPAHAAPTALPDDAQAGAPRSAPVALQAAPPTLLDDHQTRTLANLADMLVPGAVAAGVVDLVDRVLAVESAPRRREFLNALGAFEREARNTHGARWIDLDEPARLAILRRASTAPESRPLPPPWTRGEPLAFPSSGPPPPATLRDHFTRLRTIVADAYYSTEPGMKELGWRGRVAWSELPGCIHPDPEHE